MRADAPAGAGRPEPGVALDEKDERLRALLRGLGSVLVAYSGGTDSTYLAWVATHELGSRALAVTADSPSYPERHRRFAIDQATRFGFNHLIVRTAEMERPEYRANPENRCYYCKQELFGLLSGHRPRTWPCRRRRRQQRRRSRRLSAGAAGRARVRRAQPARRGRPRQGGDPGTRATRRVADWNEPASACLSSRIPYNSPVTDEKLRMIEQAEAVLLELGFRRLSCPPPRRDRPGRTGARRARRRAVSPEVGAVLAEQAEGDRFPLRDAGPAGLPHRQPQRGHSPHTGALRRHPRAGGSPRVPRRRARVSRARAGRRRSGRHGSTAPHGVARAWTPR